MSAHHVPQHSDTNDTPTSIDISRIENSDTVQSHVSISNSSKRLRISPSWGASDSTQAILDDVEVAIQHQLNHKKTDFQNVENTTQDTCLHRDLTVNTTTRTARLERVYIRRLARCTLLVYCFVSCVVATIRLYMYCNASQTQVMDHGRVSAYHPTTEAAAMSNYLTKAIPGPTCFEPFVLSDEKRIGNISLVGWLSASDIDSIRTWQTFWPGPLSILINTTAAVGSPLHADLLEKIRSYRRDGLSIHILFLKAKVSPTPNVYLNLARLMAKTDWTLLFPTHSQQHIPSGLYQAASSLDLDVKNGPIMLTMGSGNYPFPSSTTILIRRDNNLWCSERMFLDSTRDSDWDDCLWQITLEMYGTLDIVKLPFNTPERSDIAPGGRIGQRLRARFRTEMCDAVSKHLTTVVPRIRYKAMKVEWMKGFCTKTIDKKWMS